MKIVISMVLALFILGCSEEANKEVQKAEPKQVSKEVAAITKTPLQELVEKQKEVVVKETSVAVVASEVSGKAIFQACAACHGQNAEKAALGKSKVIKGWAALQVTEALNGYKDGTYGGTMKAVMKGQATKLDAEKIKAVSDYISKL
ncbi:cytochrome c, class I [Sulfurimonas gotlandica GD1]|uniref:Cytochrome c, class I n=1 Tax=Sulfurimonas gotlandica (strain DSM 19862 / JCM 16533 / GD1) TaxID=929558 RepID=H1FU94_SULGG|nr:c-type cytochrome [Sulfurimonas gotlandica]EHP28860.1 cytochrome c, class I [Sulfurimonas gotlandica GD1]